MWEARGVNGLVNRPPHPIATYPDAFAALAWLAANPAIDADRIGVLGFSWGGVISVASATQGVAGAFGHGLRFKAHVANYPVCYVYNSPIPHTEFGSHAGNPLTGAPLLIQIGSRDDYDEGAAPCYALKASLPTNEQALVGVASYAEAAHGWDRLMVPVQVHDPFAHQGAGGSVVIEPDVERAYESRMRVVRFFLEAL